VGTERDRVVLAVGIVTDADAVRRLRDSLRVTDVVNVGPGDSVNDDDALHDGDCVPV